MSGSRPFIRRSSALGFSRFVDSLVGRGAGSAHIVVGSLTGSFCGTEPLHPRRNGSQVSIFRRHWPAAALWAFILWVLALERASPNPAFAAHNDRQTPLRKRDCLRRPQLVGEPNSRPISYWVLVAGVRREYGSRPTEAGKAVALTPPRWPRSRSGKSGAVEFRDLHQRDRGRKPVVVTEAKEAVFARLAIAGEICPCR